MKEIEDIWQIRTCSKHQCISMYSQLGRSSQMPTLTRQLYYQRVTSRPSKLFQAPPQKVFGPSKPFQTHPKHLLRRYDWRSPGSRPILVDLSYVWCRRRRQVAHPVQDVKRLTRRRQPPPQKPRGRLRRKTQTGSGIYLETPNAPKFLPPQQKAPLPVICPEKGHSA